MVIDQAGAAVVEDGMETTILMIHLHHMTTKGDQAKAHTVRTNLRAGDLGCGLVHWAVLQLDMQPGAWRTEATSQTVAGAVTAAGGTTEKAARGHRPDLAPVFRTRDMRALASARLQGGKYFLEDHIISQVV